MDPNGNGFVTQKEFEQYLRSQGSHLSKERTELLFKNILEGATIDMEESGITFRDLVKYAENEEIQYYFVRLIDANRQLCENISYNYHCPISNFFSL